MITPLGQIADINTRTITGPQGPAADQLSMPTSKTELQSSGGKATSLPELPAVAISAPELPFDGSVLTGLQDDQQNGGKQPPPIGFGKQDSDDTTADENAEAEERQPLPGAAEKKTNQKGEEVNDSGLTEEDEDTVQQMKERDLEVRQHEQAHARVGGELAGAPQYDFEKGPDGNRYAVSGHVSIDVSTVPGDPDATIRKMEKVRAAALAPAEPSSQDQKVAAEAGQKAAEARIEAAQIRQEEFQAQQEDATTSEANKGADEQAGPTIGDKADELAGSIASSSAGNTASRADTGGGLSGQQSGNNAAQSAGLDNAAVGLGVGEISRSGSSSDFTANSNGNGGGSSQTARLARGADVLDFPTESSGPSRQQLAMANERYNDASRLNAPRQDPQLRLSA